MRYIETMWAEQAPDVYDGPNCDQQRPDWRGSAMGDKDGTQESIGNLIELKADTFPAGTKVVISVPICPECEESSDLANKDGKCDCGFDWKEWAGAEYS